MKYKCSKPVYIDEKEEQIVAIVKMVEDHVQVIQDKTMKKESTLQCHLVVANRKSIEYLQERRLRSFQNTKNKIHKTTILA